MSQKAFPTKDDDTFTEQQTRRWRRNEAGRRRRYGRQTQERPVTFQLNNKMLKSRGLKSSRTLQSEGAGSSHSGSQRNCAAHGNKTGQNGGQSSAVREIPEIYYDPEKNRYFGMLKDHPGKKFALFQYDDRKDVLEDNPPRINPSNIEVIKKPTKISIVKHLQQREYVRPTQIPGR